MNTIRMYSTANCSYCIAAERLLAARGIDKIEKLRIDLDPALHAEMSLKTGRRTVPQIYIGEVHVGGYTDLVELDRVGRLQSVLDAQPTLSTV